MRTFRISIRDWSSLSFEVPLSSVIPAIKTKRKKPYEQETEEECGANVCIALHLY